MITFQYGEDKNTVFGGPIPKESELVDATEMSDGKVAITYKAPGMSDAVTMTVSNILSIEKKLDN